MVDQADDRPHAERAEARQAFVRPAEVGCLEAAGSGPLPEHRLPERPHAERGQPVQVLQTARVARPLELIDVSVPQACDAALGPGPELEPLRGEPGTHFTPPWVGRPS